MTGTIKFPEDIFKMAIDIGDFITMEMPLRPMIIDPWLRQSSLVMIYAERGIGKTWFGISIALSIVTGKPIGNWEVDTPVGVLYIDGEMAADDMQERIKQLSAGLPPQLAPLKILSSDLLHQNNCASVNINRAEWRKGVNDFFAVHKEFRVLILDNLSCLTPGIEENEKESWDIINQWLIELRFLGVAVIFFHHAGKTGTQRGTSGREDSLDIVIRLSKSPAYNPKDGAKFNVSFEKNRGVYGADLDNFTFSICENMEGNTVWITNASSNSSNKERVIVLLGSGRTPNEIIMIVGCTKQNISKHKKLAIENGYLLDGGKSGPCSLTKKGREKYAPYLNDI